MTSLREIIERLERSPHHPGLFVLAFLAFVVTRNLLEGALGPTGSIGFVYFAGPSALMVLDHFLLFYVSLFLSFSVLLSAITREGVGAVMKVMTPAWALILIPPVLDHLITGGEGIRLSYLLDFRPVIFRFFDPTAALERVSPGQRVEIVAAIALAVAYVRVKGGSWLRAAVAFVSVYLLMLAHGVLPNALARLVWVVSGDPDAPQTLVYNAMYRAGGIVPDESRKLALVFLFSSCALGWWAFARFAPAKARAMLGNVRPLRSLHYVGMAGFGVALGWAVFAPVGVEYTGGGDVLGIVGVLLAVMLAFQASVSLNDLYDEEGDRLVGAPRPLVRGALTRRDAALAAGVLAGVSLLVALNVKYSTFLLVLLALVLSLAYSAPPLRLKRVPLVSNLSLGVISLLTCMAGFTAYAEERTFALFPPRLGWVIVFAFGMGFAAKDLKDRLGDGATGVVTLPVLLGERGGRVATAVLVLLGYLVVPHLLPYPMLMLPAVVLGPASAAAVLWWKHPKLDLVLLAVCLAFTAMVGCVTVFAVDEVMPGYVPIVDEVVVAKAGELAGRHAEAWGDWPRAAEQYAQAALVFSSDAGVQEEAGTSLYRAGSPEAALPHLLAAVDLDPSRPVALQNLALTEARLGRTGASNELMRDAVRRGMRPRVFLSLLGDEAARRGDAEMATDAFARALRAGQPDIPARLRLGEALLASGRLDSARDQLTMAVGRRPSSAEARDALGKFYNVVRQPVLAAEQFAEATRLDPDEPVFWNNLGVAYREAGRYPESLSALDTATEIAPRMIDPYFNRGQVLERMGRAEEARRQYLLALELNPGFQPARGALEEMGS